MAEIAEARPIPRDSSFPARTQVRVAIEVGALAVAYLLGAQVGHLFAGTGGFASPIWPPAGIAVASLFVGGRRLWPGVMLGALAVGLANGVPLVVSIPTAAAATTEAVLAVELLRRARFRPQLDRLVGVPVFALAGCALPATIGAALGVAVLAVTGTVGGADVPTAFLAWWVGDALSILVLGGLLLTWLSPPASDALRRRPLEMLVALGSVVVLSAILFFDVLDLRASGQSVAFPVIPLIVWVAFRVGPRGNALAALLFSAIAIAATERGLGPFVATTREGSMLYMAFFIAVVDVTGAAVAAVVAERDADRSALERAARRAAEALRQLEAVESIGRTLAAEGATPRAFGAVVDALVVTFGFTHPSIYTGDERHLRLGSQRGYADPPSEIDGSRGVMGRVMRTRATQFIADVSADPDYLAPDPTIRSEISVPLLSGDLFLGVLNVESQGRLDKSDLSAISVVADRVAAALALALERAHLAELAIRDGLTGLHNRRYFDDALAQPRAPAPGILTTHRGTSRSSCSTSTTSASSIPGMATRSVTKCCAPSGGSFTTASGPPTSLPATAARSSSPCCRTRSSATRCGSPARSASASPRYRSPARMVATFP
jgi:integral membrane sensor domain MASE1/putative methionine-R-sulfoxide reductase with GAF domain